MTTLGILLHLNLNCTTVEENVLEPVHNFSIEVLQKLINHGLKCDPHWKRKLLPLLNKQFLLEITNVNVVVYVAFREEGIGVMATSPSTEVDLVVRGSSGSLWRLAQSTHDTFQDHVQAVRITGDLNLAQSIKVFFHGIDIDWEEQMSRFTGDVIAHQAFRGISALREWKQEILGNFKINFREYLQEELRYFPVLHEIETFLQAVDDVRDGVEHLEARILRLGRQV